MAIIDDISAAVQAGKRSDTEKLVNQALEEGLSPDEILNEALVPAMDVVGQKFSTGELFVPEMLIAARAMSAATDILKPLLIAEGVEPIGKAVIGTVKGDMHDIGKNLVRMMVEGKGIEVEDLGVDVAPSTFIDYLGANPDVRLVLLSSLLTTTLPSLKDTVDAISDAGLRSQVKILIGGAPVTAEYAASIGADGYTGDAGAAADKAAELLRA